jgi:hypothetical protein
LGARVPSGRKYCANAEVLVWLTLRHAGRAEADALGQVVARACTWRPAASRDSGACSRRHVALNASSSFGDNLAILEVLNDWAAQIADLVGALAFAVSSDGGFGRGRQGLHQRGIPGPR